MKEVKSDGMDQQILDQELYRFFNRSRFGLAIPVFLIAMLVYVLWGGSSQPELLIWAAIALISNALRFLYMSDDLSQLNPTTVKHNLRKITWSTVAYAGSWGFGILILMPHETFQHQVFMVLMVCGIASAMAYMSVVRAYFPILFLMLCPAMIWLFIQLEEIYVEIAILMVYFLVALLMISREQFKRFRDSVLIRIEKQRLMKSEVEAKERARIMIDLHDGLGSYLMAAHSIARLNDADKGLQQALADAVFWLRTSIDTLNSDNEDIGSLFGTLRYRLDPQLKSCGIQLKWHMDDLSGCEFSSESRLHLMRIVQESITNVIKHAQATELFISTTLESDDKVCLHIQDDGCGFSDSGKGHGMSNMLSRVEALGGDMKLLSGEQGTSLTFNFMAPQYKNNSI